MYPSSSKRSSYRPDSRIRHSSKGYLKTRMGGINALPYGHPACTIRLL